MIEHIQNAAKLIRHGIIRTPMVCSPTISKMFDSEIYLKLENLQRTGSFKIRGATYKLLTRQNEIGAEGVVAASAGNHAQGVALAAHQAGMSATIVMPEWASISKQEATRNYGGEIVLFGQSLEESLQKARELAEQGKTFIHPFDDADIITGQGTIGLEILEDLNDADIVLVPIGGGGLISGIATAVKHIRPQVRVIGVQAAACPSALTSRQNNAITRVDSKTSLADGITVKQPGAINFELIEKYVDEIVTVEEEHIAAAILMLLERKKVLSEGAGAVPLAALLNGSVVIPAGSKVVLVISGGNVDSPLLGRIITKGMLNKGRIMRIYVRLSDTPGSLAGLLSLIARMKANVLHIYHDRNVRDLPINITSVELELETRSIEHIHEIESELLKAGYQITI